MASADVSMFTNMDPETRDDSEDPWRFEVSREEVLYSGSTYSSPASLRTSRGNALRSVRAKPELWLVHLPSYLAQITLPLAFLN